MSPIVKEFSQKQLDMTGRQTNEISDLKICEEELKLAYAQILNV